MSFVSNVDHLTLGEGVYNNVHGNLNNIVHNTFYIGRKRCREEIGGDSSFLEPSRKSRRREESNHGIRVISMKHLNLTCEIGSGHGYFLHSGKIKGRAVIIKVFNSGPTVREYLELTVALSKGLLHPNVLRIEGVSSPTSLTHFIAYENAFCKTAEGPLAAALRDDLTKSITLGFKMIAGLSVGLVYPTVHLLIRILCANLKSGMNYLSAQGTSLDSLGVENFDIFLDINDRFLICINPRLSRENAPGDQQPQDNTTRSWAIFNALCQRVLRSANRLLHNENIERTPVIPDTPRRPPVPQESSSTAPSAPPESSEPTSSQNAPENEAPILPRREYVWRTIERRHQSLATIAARIALDLDMKLSPSLNKLALSDGRNPGSRPTVKCQICKYWSHSDCCRISTDFTCEICVPGSIGSSPRDAQTALLPSARIHSLLSFAPFTPIAPPVNYDLSHPPHTINPQVTPWFFDPATFPPLPALTVTCLHLPWSISVSPSQPTGFVSVLDVFTSVYPSLRLAVRRAEYDTLLSADVRQSVDDAYFMRCRLLADEEERKIEALKGVKRVDFLLWKNSFPWPVWPCGG
ncbi:hypothetical protein MVEN_02517700 [Mycena venus]|uniref:DUF6699 domain-containing protein n=1 Tax=Mycena venus TaxID=2733690 RepID=A0A8H6WUJ5_9AGAR|nr:hypothetical protein MVEN_02517700 [Mycena venus]